MDEETEDKVWGILEGLIKTDNYKEALKMFSPDNKDIDLDHCKAYFYTMGFIAAVYEEGDDKTTPLPIPSN